MKKNTKKEINELAIKVLGNKENFKTWKSTPQISLNNEKPEDYLDDSTKREILINLLNAMENSIYL